MRRVKLLGSKLIVKRKRVQSILDLSAAKSIDPTEGEVVAMSEDCQGIVEIGDLIVYGKYAAFPIEDEEENLYIMDSGDILYIVEEEINA